MRSWNDSRGERKGTRNMQAMVLSGTHQDLQLKELAKPSPGKGEILVKVSACGVCSTDLHVMDGELKGSKLPLVPGHEIVGKVEAMGDGVTGFTSGQRVGVPWLGGTCGDCRYCKRGHENLCYRPVFTGYQKNGGYAQYTLANSRYC